MTVVTYSDVSPDGASCSPSPRVLSFIPPSEDEAMTFTFVDINPDHDDASKRVKKADVSPIRHKFETDVLKEGVAPKSLFIHPISQKYRQTVVPE